MNVGDDVGSVVAGSKVGFVGGAKVSRREFAEVQMVEAMT